MDKLPWLGASVKRKEDDRLLRSGLQDADHAGRADTDVIIVESGHDEGPYGAKGIGESAIAPVPGALGNAVYDAVGVEVKDLPIRAEKVYRALRR